MVHAAARVSGHGGDDRSQDSSGSLVKLAKVLCAPMSHRISDHHADKPCRLQTSKGLSRRSPVPQSSWSCFAETDEFFARVSCQSLTCRPRTATWHASRDVARTETGVARRHRLISELRPILRLSGDEPVPHPTSNVGSSRWRGTGPRRSGRSGEILRALAWPSPAWRRGRVPQFVGQRFAQCSIGNLAEQWLGEDVSIEGLRSKLGLDRHSPESVSGFRRRFAHGRPCHCRERPRIEGGDGGRSRQRYAVRRRSSSSIPLLAKLSWSLAQLGEVSSGKSLCAISSRRGRSNVPTSFRLLGDTVERWAVASTSI